MRIEGAWVKGVPIDVVDLSGILFIGESGAHTFAVTREDEAGNTIAFTGAVKGTFLDSTGVTTHIDGGIQDGVAVITLPGICYTVPGRFVVAVYAEVDGAMVCVYSGVGSVFETQTDIIMRQDEVEELEATIRRLRAAISRKFSTGQEYSEGDYCWYDDVLYQALQDIPAGQAWNDEQWRQVVITDVLEDIADQQTQQDAAIAQNAENIAANTERITQNAADIDTLEGRATSLEGRADAIEAEQTEQNTTLAQHGARLDADEADIAAIKVEQDTQDAAIAQNAGDITALDQRVDALETSQGQQDTAIQGLGTRMDGAESDIDNLEASQTTQDTAIQGLGTRMSTAETNIDNLETSQAQQDADISALQGRVTTAESDISGLGTRMTAAESGLSDVTGDVATLEQCCQTVQADIADLDQRVTVLEHPTPPGPARKVYGFRIDSSESDPAACVTYLEDAVGKTPAHMDYTAGAFDWGDWAQDEFFIPRPCMLNYDGTVAYYLDPSDYSKKADGTASDVAGPSFSGNAMMEWGRDDQIIWYKIVPDENDDTSANIYIANDQIDEGYHCWSFINGDDVLVPHFYTPCYFGSVIDGKLRSLSGQSGSIRCKNTTASVERTYAKANNPTGIDIWDIEVYADIILINLLLVLLGKSLNTQAVYGEGFTSGGSDSVNNSFVNGVHDAAGLFYGSASAGIAVKVFGMENWWGFMYRRFVGLATTGSYILMYKFTRGIADGSTAADYTVSSNAVDYNGYIDGPQLATSNISGYLSKCKFDGSQMLPYLAGGTESTYYCDGYYFYSGLYLPVRGGDSYFGRYAGAFYGLLNNAPGYAVWVRGAAPSCKPKAT